jgi:hypothetical protein
VFEEVTTARSKSYTRRRLIKTELLSLPDCTAAKH